MELVMPVGMKSLRIFVSYDTAQKQIAGKLKEELEKSGFEVFIAHDDILASADWQNEIIKNLKRCDIFVPIITSDFKMSDWTDQETGIAISEGKLVIPIFTNIEPYGFIKKYQGIRLKDDEITTIIQSILEAIINNPKFGQEIKDFAINSLISSGSFAEANKRSENLGLFNDFSSEQIIRLVNGTQNNNQIYGAGIASGRLKRLFTKYNAVIPQRDKELLTKLL